METGFLHCLGHVVNRHRDRAGQGIAGVIGDCNIELITGIAFVVCLEPVFEFQHTVCSDFKETRIFTGESIRETVTMDVVVIGSG